MNTEIKNMVLATTEKAEYDQGAKRLLGQKIILAHILVKTVKEYQGMSPKDVVQYIEGEPLISMVPVEPGLTNMEMAETGSRIVGFNTENAENYEGLIRFDIVFYVRTQNGISQIIINVEAQKAEPVEYHLLNRAIFYVCRLISSQKERDFVNMKYDDIRQVHSIWICMNMSENCMEHIHLTRENLLGNHHWEGHLDLLNVVMIGLAKTLPEMDEKYELHRLLAALLSTKLQPGEKLAIIEKEYSIALEDSVRREMTQMCNLGEGIWEEAYKTAYETATVEYIVNMYKKNYTVEQIADVTDKTIAEIEDIIRKEDLVSV